MSFPALAHVAVTVRDLAVSTPWYRALFDSDPVLDEDTDAGFHHVVWQLGDGTIIEYMVIVIGDPGWMVGPLRPAEPICEAMPTDWQASFG